MYLLKLDRITIEFDQILFTFHYVSIKTETDRKDSRVDKNLHSTMYLLKL